MEEFQNIERNIFIGLNVPALFFAIVEYLLTNFR